MSASILHVALSRPLQGKRQRNQQRMICPLDQKREGSYREDLLGLCGDQPLRGPWPTAEEKLHFSLLQPPRPLAFHWQNKHNAGQPWAWGPHSWESISWGLSQGRARIDWTVEVKRTTRASIARAVGEVPGERQEMYERRRDNKWNKIQDMTRARIDDLNEKCQRAEDKM